MQLFVWDNEGESDSDAPSDPTHHRHSICTYIIRYSVLEKGYTHI